MHSLTRRKLLQGGVGLAAGAVGAGAAGMLGWKVAGRMGLIAPDATGFYGPGEALTYAASRIVTPGAMAREFPRTHISAKPFANSVYGTPAAEYVTQKAEGFAHWTLSVEGMAMHPTRFTIGDLKAMPVASHVTEIACEEGWSYIAEWIGTPLRAVLREVQPLGAAKYLVYTSMRDGLWDSLDLDEAGHPQTLLTWAMNDADLAEGFGGPLRMRLPKQLGYRNVKHVHRIVLTDSLKGFGKGMGSENPEFGYSWYAGI